MTALRRRPLRMSRGAVRDADVVQELEFGEVRVQLRAGARQRAEDALAALLGDAAGVPAGDVELERRCRVCGAAHGHPLVEYPQTPSGGEWFADAAAAAGFAVAAVSKRHPLGVAIPPARLGDEADDAAFHPLERSALAGVGDEDRARLRAELWAGKEALMRALGHNPVTDPGGIALARDGDGLRIERLGDELPPHARDAALHVIRAEERTAVVAVLARG
ncbi:4'-phosphopantetheinyl transferase family protein [Agromyces archimandritae]|uniref:4-phosphopantetheinyl transferase family protein n=1 Tax=Agromyces archimandritae TaxID=2781962 RepID=A0A975FNI2_9MICO|nr:4'-phosphopantetheinyl transferase superfamily protein [Agromyces archimandritae]QTX05129.1 4-phosphopantetheinyl transferase family protein [Agromyces archimandritae]